jgi:hypothetical protein
LIVRFAGSKSFGDKELSLTSSADVHRRAVGAAGAMVTFGSGWPHEERGRTNTQKDDD